MYLKCGLNNSGLNREWPDSSAGRALHWHHRGQGSKPCSGLNFSCLMRWSNSFINIFSNTKTVTPSFINIFSNTKTVTPCLLFILHPIYLHNLSPHVFTANQITHLPTVTLSTDQSNRSPGFLNFQLTNTITWLWRWLPHRLSKRQSLTTVLLRPPITQMIFFNQGMLLLGSNHFLRYYSCYYYIKIKMLINDFDSPFGSHRGIKARWNCQNKDQWRWCSNDTPHKFCSFQLWQTTGQRQYHVSCR